MPVHPLVASMGAVLVVGLTTLGSIVGLARPAGEPDATVASKPAVTRVRTVTAVERPTTLRPRRTCDQVTHAFRPRAVSVPGVTPRSSIVTPPRDANGIPGVPPLTDAGKRLSAWDRA